MAKLELDRPEIDLSVDRLELDNEAKKLLETLAVGDGIAEEVSSALKALLWEDEADMGRVFRAWVRMGQPAQKVLSQILEINGGTVSNYMRGIRVTLGIPIQTRTSIRYSKTSILKFRRRVNGNDALQKHLDNLLFEIESIVSDANVVAEEEAGNQRRTGDLIELAESTQVLNCIYAFSYRHYISHPAVEPGDLSPRFWIKVGSTTAGIAQRMTQHRQSAVTVLPEHPVLLGVWEVVNGDVQEIEKRIHRHLVDVDFRRSTSARSGRDNEWFMVTLEAISSTASILGLREVGVADFM